MLKEMTFHRFFFVLLLCHFHYTCIASRYVKRAPNINRLALFNKLITNWAGHGNVGIVIAVSSANINAIHILRIVFMCHFCVVNFHVRFSCYLLFIFGHLTTVKDKGLFCVVSISLSVTNFNAIWQSTKVPSWKLIEVNILQFAV